MGRPRKDGGKSEGSSKDAGRVYNASLAAAHQQKQASDHATATSSALNTSTSCINSFINTTSETNGISKSSASFLSPHLDAISLTSVSTLKNETCSPNSTVAIVSPENEISVTTSSTIPSPPIANSSSPTTNSNHQLHNRSLSVSEIVSLISTSTSEHSSSTNSLINSLNLPHALKSTLERADSPILNALIPLIRQKLAVKTAEAALNSTINRKNSIDVNFNVNSTSSLDSQSSRRSSTSTRSEDHRLSHKLAERKRRKEMKDIFDGLKNALPPSAPKSSKWEILSEASATIDDLLTQEQNLLDQRNQLLKKINESS